MSKDKHPRALELSELREDLESLTQVRGRMVARLTRLMSEMVLECLDLEHQPTAEQLTITDKKCAQSPIELCVFHGVRDTTNQHCFFCSDPE